MYDLEHENGSAKCSGPLQDCGPAGNTPPSYSEPSSGARPLGDASRNDTETTHDRERGRWVRAAQLAELFRSWDLAYRCTRGGWLSPIVRGKRRTIYRLADVLVCMHRIEAGELPPPRRSKTTP